MKNLILALIVICTFCSIASQESNDVNLIEADSTWGKEIIEIPFWFAPKINYKGYEDIRFAKGWEKSDSNGFWTLAFAWDINLKKQPTADFFEENLKLYFDGLMKVVNEDESIKIPKTRVSIKETNTINDAQKFIGTLATYDAFTTRKVIKINVAIEIYYCMATKNYVPLFKMCPKEFDHQSWKMLNSIRISSSLCEE